jgi:hypothetical protein
MNITLEKNAKSVELIKMAGSRNKAESAAAMEVVAAFATPIIQTVIDKAGVSNTIFKSWGYDQDTNPSIPLDIWIDKKVDHVRVWSQTIAGGLPTNYIQGLTELKFSPYDLDTAISMDKKFARVNGLENVSRALKRMAQELLIKQEINRFTPLLAALAVASTNNLAHAFAATATGVLQMDDFNSLLLRGRLINAAWDGGTPDASSAKGVTDVYLSATMMAQIRSFVYQPMNTRTVPAAGANTAMPLPDSIREEIYRNAGTSEVFGIGLHEVLELESTGIYSLIFDSYYAGTFTPGTHSLVLGIDATRDGLLAPYENSDNGGNVSTLPDDQFVARSNKIGWYAHATQNAVVADDRQVLGLIV